MYAKVREHGAPVQGASLVGIRKAEDENDRQHPDQTQGNEAGQIPMPYRQRKGSSAYECLASTGSAVCCLGSGDRLPPSSFQLISNSSLRSRTASPRAPPK